ncbi:MAG: four helix bundle protein [Ignavibacteriae bacterium]|nr:four helix bundle protein [Ignavibacteriota bacterium]
MGEIHDFRKLDVYKRALLFTKIIRQVTAMFPKDELFSLTSQYRRAIDSVVLNISEGAGSGTKKEFAKFLGYSIRSGYECGGCADIAAVQKYISKKEYEDLIKETDEIVSMLIGLQRSLGK